MILTKEFLKEKNACSDGYEWACENLIGLGHLDVLEKLIKSNKLDWANWYITKLMTKEQCVQYAIFAAMEVIENYEKKYPNDKRPRQAIEAAENYLKNPSEENRDAAVDASDAANATSDAAANACRAAINAANAAVYAADADLTARATAAAANAAKDAVGYAADAADAATEAAAAAADAAVANSSANAAKDAAVYGAALKEILRYGMEML